MRTITQRTTLPFLMAESGAASFTLAVTTSPKPARRPRSPPRGKMHARRRAPLLSATSRIVLIPIIGRSLPGLGGRGGRLRLFSRAGQPLVPDPYTFTSNSSGCTPTCGARRITSASRQRFKRLNGRHSIILTTSPILALLSSSCAWNLLRFFTIRLYNGCGTRRLTSTRMVLVDLVETTSPIFSFFNGLCVCSAILLLSSRQFPLSNDGIDTGAVFFHGARLFEAFHGAHGHLKMQPEKLLLDGAQLMLQLDLAEIPNLLRLHGLLRLLPRYKFGTDGQFVGRQPHGIGRHIRGNALHFE